MMAGTLLWNRRMLEQAVDTYTGKAEISNANQRRDYVSVRLRWWHYEYFHAQDSRAVKPMTLVENICQVAECDNSGGCWVS